MKLTLKTISAIISIILPILSLATYCGVLKAQINQNEKQIIILKAEVKEKDIELKKEIEKKVDIEVFNSVTKNLYDSIDLLRIDNKEDHEKIDKSLQNVNDKLDRLIERK